MLKLLSDRRFAGLFWTQLLGAFNDNFFKNALVILVLYRLAGAQGPLLVTAAAGIFILPFFLFSAQAGTLADGMDKARLARAVKLAEIAIMALGALALTLGSVSLLLVVLFLMGAQSAVFGPVKYGIVPDLVREDEVMGANALIEAATFLAILGGTILGGLLILRPNGLAWVCAGILGMAVLGWLASRTIPLVPAREPGLRPAWTPWRAIGPAVADLRRDPRLWRATLSVSWFWFVGAVYLAQIPTLVKAVLGADEGVVTLFLTVFSLGIGLGSLLAQRLTGGAIRLTPVPLAGLAIALVSVDLFLALGGASPARGTLVGVGDFLATFGGWRIVLGLLGLAVAGGLFVVPLMAAIQTWAPVAHRARVIAALNIVNAGFMVVSALFTLALQALGLTVPAILLLTGLATLPVTLLTLRLLPRETRRAAVRRLLQRLFRVEVTGAEHLRGLQGPAVIVANHQSLLDGPLLLAFLAAKPVFAIDTGMATKWWIRPFLGFAEALPLDPANPLSLRKLTEAVRGGRHLVIFPEGRITTTGGLMRVQDGPAVVADKAGAPVVPVRIQGAERSRFSRLRPTMTRRLWLPKITLTIGAPERLDLDPSLKGKARREAGGHALYDLMCRHMARCETGQRSLPEALLDAARYHGMNRTILEDAQGRSLTYRRLVAGALGLGRRLAQASEPGERVGVLLPNSAGMALAILGLLGQGRVAAILNPTAGLTPLRQCVGAATLRTVVTSERFVEIAKLGEVVQALQEDGVRVVHLEALAGGIGRREGLQALLATWRRRPFAPSAPNDPAVVLFTSGSEGAPKGVVLSHDNLVANAAQGAVRFDLTHEDRVLGVLPLFHSFGLSGGLVLPLLKGATTFLYPSPLHYRQIPEVAYGTNATILFGTDTFLMGYARKADPFAFQSLRYVVAGAEPVKPETRRVWAERFGLRVLEGYGLTEASPVVALNTPLHARPGTVGRFLPLVEHRLEPVEGIEAGGRLILRGPNVMLGYLLLDEPGVLRPPPEGWHDTGDIVTVDGSEGYVRVTGRVRRFAKLGGEMVSLAAVEALAARLWPDAAHGVVALKDPRKGERLALATTEPDADRRALHAFLKRAGMAELLLPDEVRVVDALPMLASGKTDYPALSRLFEQRAADADATAA